MSTIQRTSSRNRTQVQHPGQISTDSDAFESTIHYTAAAPQPTKKKPLSQGLGALLSTQQVFGIPKAPSSARSVVVAAAAEATKAGADDDTRGIGICSESDDELELEQTYVQQREDAAALAVDLTDNDEQNYTPSTSLTTPAEKKRKRSLPLPPKRLSAWTHAEELELCSAVQLYVKTHGGSLPGAIRTTKSSSVTPGWKRIATTISKVKGMSDDAAARACSGRWQTMRSRLKVRRHTKQTYIDEQNIAMTDIMYSLHLCVPRIVSKRSLISYGRSWIHISLSKGIWNYNSWMNVRKQWQHMH
jgi:hypothetical protein